MAGQIIKRGERTWLVRIFRGRDANGKRRYANKTVHGTKNDAQKFLNGALRDKDLGVFIEPAKEALGAYLDKWLETAARTRVRESTLEDYKDNIERYIRPALGERRLSDLRPLDVQKLYSDLQARGLSARSLSLIHI